MVCFDTSIVIDFLKGKEYLSELISEYAGNIYITALTKYELLKTPGSGSDKDLISFLNSVSILNFNSKTSEVAAEIYLRLKKEGKMINEMDILIAATSISNDEILITKDIDFSNVKIGKITVIQAPKNNG